MNQAPMPFWPVCPIEFGRRLCAAARKHNIEPSAVRDSRGNLHLALPYLEPIALAGIVIDAAEGYTRPSEPLEQGPYAAFVGRAFAGVRVDSPNGPLLTWPGVPDPHTMASAAFAEPRDVPRGRR